MRSVTCQGQVTVEGKYGQVVAIRDCAAVAEMADMICGKANYWMCKGGKEIQWVVGDDLCALLGTPVPSKEEVLEGACNILNQMECLGIKGKAWVGIIESLVHTGDRQERAKVKQFVSTEKVDSQTYFGRTCSLLGKVSKTKLCMKEAGGWL